MTPDTVNKIPNIDLNVTFSFRKNIEIGRAKNGDIEPRTEATNAPIIFKAYARGSNYHPLQSFRNYNVLRRICGDINPMRIVGCNTQSK